MTLIKFYSDM